MVVSSSAGSGGGKPDVAGLWIEYVLLPERLDEHLAGLSSGAASSPSHVELINMFLEQAVATHKLSRKEPDAQGGTASRSSGGRTASVLCERAVRVAVAARFTLSEVEEHVPRQHQSLLLKALIKYDKVRSLLHECNFHRWVIRKWLAPGNSLENPPDIIEDSGMPSGSEEGPSVQFLEGVIEKEKAVFDGYQVRKKNGMIREDGLTGALLETTGLTAIDLSKMLFDVAEAHFMKGRVKRAHELFIKCGHFSAEFVDSCPILRDRLNGFIVACRAVAGGAVLLEEEQPQERTIFECEKSRSSMKRKLQSSDHCNGLARSKKAECPKDHKRENGDHLMNGCELRRSKSMGPSPTSEDNNLIDILADDISRRQLSLGYTLSLEKDTTLQALVRCKVAMCNVLRSVIEGGSFDAFLRISEQLEDNKEAVLFLMQLISNVIARSRSEDSNQVVRLQQFCTYVCCTLEEPWCWRLACKHGLVASEFAPKTESPQSSRDDGSGGLPLLRILQAANVAMVENAACGQSPENLARCLQLRAFYALDKEKDFNLARQLYSVAKQAYPKGIDSELFLWYLDQTVEYSPLPEKIDEYIPTFGALEYIFVKLIEAEQWSSVVELCSWAKRNRHFMEDKATAFIIDEANIFGTLMPMCEDPAKKDEIFRGLEDLLFLLFSTRDGERGSLRDIPIVSRLSTVRALETLESLLAGWIHSVFLTTPILELARYGVFAQTMALDSRFKEVNGFKDSGKKLFRNVLKRLLKITKNAEEDKGSRWLLGLADLAFVDRAYLESLQLYLQAGAVRTSFYCDRVASMAREFFTPWVIRRMIAACKEIGAHLQAAILCQYLPDPDYESAFQILRENSLIVDRDAALYFDCLWEVPLLELLVHMHQKAGDKVRVNTLTNLLQQPGMNVHNPAPIRQAHIATMGQRFLQRFYAELM